MSRPIALTDQQMDAVLAGAHPLQPHRRGPFLEACAQELARLGEIGDGDVHRVVMEVQRRHFDPPAFDRDSGGSRSRRRIADDSEDDRPRRRVQPRTLGAL